MIFNWSGPETGQFLFLAPAEEMRRKECRTSDHGHAEGGRGNSGRGCQDMPILPD
jgi:hypothetical protein